MQRRPEDYEPVRVPNTRCVRQTDKAILVHVEGFGGPDQWVPQSQVHDDSEVSAFLDEGTLVIPRWLAREKGWE